MQNLILSSAPFNHMVLESALVGFIFDPGENKQPVASSLLIRPRIRTRKASARVHRTIIQYSCIITISTQMKLDYHPPILLLLLRFFHKRAKKSRQGKTKTTVEVLTKDRMIMVALPIFRPPKNQRWQFQFPMQFLPFAPETSSTDQTQF